MLLLMSETALIICVNRRASAHKPSCAWRGSDELADLIEQALADAGLNVPVKRVYCLGECRSGPNLRIAPSGPLFHHFSREDIPALLEALQSF